MCDGQAWPAYQIHEGVFRSCNSYPERGEGGGGGPRFRGGGGLLPSSFNGPVLLVFAARFSIGFGEAGRGY